MDAGDCARDGAVDVGFVGGCDDGDGALEGLEVSVF